MTRDELIEQAAKNYATEIRDPDPASWFLDDARDWLEILEPLIRESIAEDIEAEAERDPITFQARSYFHHRYVTGVIAGKRRSATIVRIGP